MREYADRGVISNAREITEHHARQDVQVSVGLSINVSARADDTTGVVVQVNAKIAIPIANRHHQGEPSPGLVLQEKVCFSIESLRKGTRGFVGAAGQLAYHFDGIPPSFNIV